MYKMPLRESREHGFGITLTLMRMKRNKERAFVRDSTITFSKKMRSIIGRIKQSMSDYLTYPGCTATQTNSLISSMF